MSDPDFAREVGLMMHEELEVDPRLDRWAAGSLSPEETAALEVEALENRELAEALELFRPSSEAELTMRLETATQARDLAPVIRLPVKVGAGATAAAAAAALMFSLRAPNPGPFPPMALEVGVGDRVQRGAEAVSAPVVDPRSELKLLLRPERELSTPVEAALYVLDTAGARRTDVPVRLAESGAAQVRVPVGRLGEGTLTAILVVARPGRLPSPSKVLEFLVDATARGSGWEGKAVRLRVAGPRAPPVPSP